MLFLGYFKSLLQVAGGRKMAETAPSTLVSEVSAPEKLVPVEGNTVSHENSPCPSEPDEISAAQASSVTPVPPPKRELEAETSQETAETASAAASEAVADPFQAWFSIATRPDTISSHTSHPMVRKSMAAIHLCSFRNLPSGKRSCSRMFLFNKMLHVTGYCPSWTTRKMCF